MEISAVRTASLMPTLRGEPTFLCGAARTDRIMQGTALGIASAKKKKTCIL